LSPYFIHCLVICCKALFAIYIAPYHFSYFLFCPSLSLFYLCTFRCILGWVALTVSEWSAWSCLVAVTFLSLRSTLLFSTPDISIPGIIIIIIIMFRGTTIYCSERYQAVPARLSHKGRPQTRSGLGSQEGTNDGKRTVEYAAKEISGEFGVILCVGGLQHKDILCVGCNTRIFCV
jgi:hypothetical protein